MMMDFLVYSKDFKGGFERWKDGSLIIYTSDKETSEYHIKLEHGLQKHDKIKWVDELQSDIKNEYKKQIGE